jgi:cell pole-organizing protein PopZ
MASPSSPQHEPTMEEILASIRKIISEDSNEQHAPQASPEVDVLELTQEVEEEPVPAPTPVVAAVPPRPVEDVEFRTVAEQPRSPIAPSNGTDSLVSDKARSAVDDALSGLDFGPEEPPVVVTQVAAPAGRSVEAVFDRAVRETFDPVLRQWLQEQADVIVERMKPAIREWMEDNLPSMLKDAVEAEVARAVRARTRR